MGSKQNLQHHATVTGLPLQLDNVCLFVHCSDMQMRVQLHSQGELYCLEAERDPNDAHEHPYSRKDVCHKECPSRCHHPEDSSNCQYRLAI